MNPSSISSELETTQMTRPQKTTNPFLSLFARGHDPTSFVKSLTMTSTTTISTKGEIHSSDSSESSESKSGLSYYNDDDDDHDETEEEYDTCYHRHPMHSHKKPSKQKDACCVPTSSEYIGEEKDCNADDEYIDNTTLVYVPLRLPRSKVAVRVCPRVLQTFSHVLLELDEDLVQCFQILPSSVHALVKRTVIWINPTYAYGPKHAPTVLNHSTAHHHPSWLLVCAHDIPDKARGIEIYNCYDYSRMRWHWNGCGLMLHELIHLIHQFALGLDFGEIRRAYHVAHHSGMYRCTPRRDWAGKAVETDMHYAMINHKEFFAELSVTFLAKGYSSHQLSLWRPGNPVISCSPPLLEPHVLARVHSATTAFEQQFRTPTASPCKTTFCTCVSQSVNFSPFARLRQQRPAPFPHCNKFYPFTSRQLQQHDPSLYTFLHRLWTLDIPSWRDPEQIEEDDLCHCWWLWPLRTKVHAVT